MSTTPRRAARQGAKPQTGPRPVRFIVRAPRGLEQPEPDFGRMGLVVTNRSPGSWLVQGLASTQAVRDALDAQGLHDWSVHPEQFYRLA